MKKIALSKKACFFSLIFVVLLIWSMSVSFANSNENNDFEFDNCTSIIVGSWPRLMVRL